ncbi:hypothetical protein OAU26_08800, partial [Mariniblastus sp.]|nr:hypothetical protein [Mariniblastus sp.]
MARSAIGGNVYLKLAVPLLMVSVYGGLIGITLAFGFSKRKQHNSQLDRTWQVSKSGEALRRTIEVMRRMFRARVKGFGLAIAALVMGVFAGITIKYAANMPWQKDAEQIRISDKPESNLASTEAPVSATSSEESTVVKPSSVEPPAGKSEQEVAVRKKHVNIIPAEKVFEKDLKSTTAAGDQMIYRHITMSPTGKYFLLGMSGGGNHTLELWDISTNKKIAALKDLGSKFSADGNQLTTHNGKIFQMAALVSGKIENTGMRAYDWIKIDQSKGIMRVIEVSNDQKQFLLFNQNADNPYVVFNNETK